ERIVTNREIDSRTAEVVQAWLVSKLSELLGIEPREMDVREPFASYGLGSAELVSLSGELGEWLGRQLPAELAYECPTIEALSRRLAESSDASHLATEGPPQAQPAIEVSGVREADAEAI